MKSTYFLTAIYASLLFAQASCRKLIEIDAPETSVNSENIYDSDATAISVLTAVYAKMSNSAFGSENPFTGVKSAAVLSGLSSDELTLFEGITNPDYKAYYLNALGFNGSSATFGSEYWKQFYNYIFLCNSALEGLNKSSALSPLVKQQLLGEAKFLRGYYYFYLVNLYGDVPLINTTDPIKNATFSRTATSEVYAQIIEDLKDAKAVLAETYLDGSLQNYSDISERVRPTKWAAQAVLARVYLFIHDYPKAESEATEVINNTSLFGLTALNDAFLKNSNEAIWQLQPVMAGHNSEDGWVFILSETGPDYDFSSPNPVYLNTHLLSSFESGDERRLHWVDSVIVDTDTFYFPYKYKSATEGDPVTEYQMMLRLGEQYLIRAEAKAQQDNLPGAIADLNAIRSRAGLSGSIATTKDEILTAIMHERQVELFTEAGHRWLDLKRTGTIDSIMPSVTDEKGGSWQTTDKLYPLPVDDIQKNQNLIQNIRY